MFNEPTQCDVYLEALDLPTPEQIISALLGHAVFNFNMSGAGVLTDISQIPEFLNDCDQHQVVHLNKFSDCLTVISVLVEVPTQVLRDKFLELREELDGEFVASQIGSINFEEMFFSGENSKEGGEEGSGPKDFFNQEEN